MVTSNIRSTLRATLACLVALLLTALLGRRVRRLQCRGTPGSAVITTSALPDAQVNDCLQRRCWRPRGGTAPYTWALTAGTLPPGLLAQRHERRHQRNPDRGASAVTLTLHAQDAGSPAAPSSATLPFTCSRP